MIQVERSLNGDLVAITPAGTSLRLDPELCHFQLQELLQRQVRDASDKIGGWRSPTQWDLDEPARKARIWAQFNQRPASEYFERNVAVLPPALPGAAQAPRIRKFSERGVEQITLEDLGF